jgi:hypothetical protein
MKLYEILHEALNWDFTEIEMYNSRGIDPESSYSEIIWVNPVKILDNMSSDWKVYRGHNEIGNRLDRAVKHFKDNQPMTPPLVSYNPHDKQHPVGITNGRHRIAAAIELNQKSIPIAVTQVDKDILYKLLN